MIQTLFLLFKKSNNNSAANSVNLNKEKRPVSKETKKQSSTKKAVVSDSDGSMPGLLDDSDSDDSSGKDATAKDESSDNSDSDFGSRSERSLKTKGKSATGSTSFGGMKSGFLSRAPKPTSAKAKSVAPQKEKSAAVEPVVEKRPLPGLIYATDSEDNFDFEEWSEDEFLWKHLSDGGIRPPGAISLGNPLERA